ncbi:hypothetical protein [Pseudomonas aeruginosa]|uniref:hypothetical protein n=2 Tax=Pseudomonas aeruginosa TaxID=287 RepID=UPI0035C106F0
MTWRPWLVVALVAALVFWRLDHVTAQRDDLQAAVEQSAETITAMAQQAQRDRLRPTQWPAHTKQHYRLPMKKTNCAAMLSALVLASCTSKPAAPQAECTRLPEPPAALMQEEPSLLPLMDRLFLISEPESSDAN